MLTKVDIDWLKSEFLPDLAKAVRDGLSKQLTDISTKLDKFVGDVQTKREEQTLHDGSHQVIDHRLTRLEKHAKLPTLAD